MRSATHAERSGESPRRRSHEMSGAAEEAMRSATKSGITTTLTSISASVATTTRARTARIWTLRIDQRPSRSRNIARTES